MSWKITENDFMTDNCRVKYSDALGNTITVRPKRDGSSLSIKFRPIDNFTVDAVKFVYPYEDAGMHVLINRPEGFEDPEYLQGALQEMCEQAEKWIAISRELKTLASDMKSFSAMLAKTDENKANHNLSPDDIEYNLTASAVDALMEYPEVEEFVDYYVRALQE